MLVLVYRWSDFDAARPQWYKNYMTGLICLAMMMCNFLAAGNSPAIK